ncbi:TetR/AcrR family transcriptional regulator [Planctomycetota bacterium]|nr:TetR/AcrR family transcriptional regulator [Planctomycetota bacterium]
MTEKQEGEMLAKKPLEGMRLEIAQAAMGILAAEGMDSLTSGRLCSVMGISKGTLFHHFPNMDRVKLSVLKYLVDQMENEVRSREHKDVWEYIYDTCDTSIRALEKHRDVFAALFYFMSKSVHDPEIRGVMQAYLDRSMAEWTEILFGYVGGNLPTEEKDHIARTIDMFFGGFFIHNFIYDDLPRYRVIAEEFLDMIVTHIENSVREMNK